MPFLRSAVGMVCALLLVACGDAALPTAAEQPLTATAETTGAVLATASAAAVTVDSAPVLLVSDVGTRLCATAASGTPTAGAALVAAPCAGASAAQQFTFTAAGAVTTGDGSLCVDVAGAVTNGSRLVLAACDGGARQRWTYTAARTLVGPNGRCVDLSVLSGTLGVWSCHGRNNQRWTREPVEATPPAPSGGPWTYCVAAGAPCEFIGLRTVRLGAGAGAYVQQVAMSSVPCAAYGFGDQNPAPGKVLHCDYGPLLTSTLTNPMPGMGPLAGSTVVVPRGGPGAAGAQARATSEKPSPYESGSFRTTCTLASYAFNDPIVFPGHPGASHLHAFFGNAGVNASSTPAQLVASGNSTCRGGTLNRSAYWVPALVDTKTGAVLPPADAIIYYKTGYGVKPSTVRAFPAGLRMIAGDMRATGAQTYVSWGCRDLYVVSATVPTTCPVGDAVRLTVQFPQCWDGVNLDAPDHKSHMAYPVYRNAPQYSTCPATHPVMLPEITEHFDYPVAAGAAPAGWRLASDVYAASTRGGLSAHADWMNGWDPATMTTIVTKCLNRSVDCGVGAIGDGRELY